MRASIIGAPVLWFAFVLLAAGCGKTLSPAADRSSALEPASAGGATIECRAPSGLTWVLDAVAVGPIVTLTADGQPVVRPQQVFPLSQEYAPGVVPRDTVPAHSVAYVRWRLVGGPRRPARAGPEDGGDRFSSEDVARHFRPGIGEGAPVDTQALVPGLNLITVEVPEEAGGGTRTLVCWGDFAPDTWWAGPDPALWPLSTDGENARAVDVTDWGSFATSAAWPPDGRAYFGPDSFRYLPSLRQPLRGPGSGTFYEIYGNRVYARAQGDTVHMNSFVVLWNGGYDKDSEYVPRVDPADPALPDGFATDPVAFAVLHSLGLVGSPIGFRSLVVTRLTPYGLKSTPPQTTLYPVFEPASVYRSPVLGGYWRVFQAGKAYALARSQDYEGALDQTVGDPAALADAVDGGTGTPEQLALRPKVLTFHVDKAPALVRDELFRPYDGQVITSERWEFYLQGMDLDPYDPRVVGWPGGGPTPSAVTRFRISLYGKSIHTGSDTAWTYVAPDGLTYINQGSPVALSFIPGGTMATNPFASGDIAVSIEICDCIDCEGSPGQGRCVQGIDPVTGQVVNPENVITVHYTRPGAGS